MPDSTLPESDGNPTENRTLFSILDIIDRLDSTAKQAVICLTETRARPDYSHHQGLQYEHGSMSSNCSDNESPLSPLKSESARQRWDLFHRAIAHAKQSNTAALQDGDTTPPEPKQSSPALTIIK